MGRGLIGSAMLSGLGQGLGEAAKTGMNVVGASMLQRERNEMEMRKAALLETSANAREQRGYAHSEKLAQDAQANARTMQKETIAHADRAQDKTLAHDDDKLGRTQDFTREENDKTREQHRADQLQAKDIAEKTLAQGDERLKNDKEYHSASIRIAQGQLDAAKDKATLMPMSDGSIYRVDAQGKVLGKALDPETGKPLQGTKDLPATTKLLVEVNKTMIQQLGEQLKNQSLLPDERSTISAQMTRLKGDIESLLGRAPVKSGATQIIDPAATVQAPDATTAKGDKPAPAPKEKIGLAGYLEENRDKLDSYLASLPKGPGDDVAGGYVDEKRAELQARADAIRKQGGTAPTPPTQTASLTDPASPPSGLLAAAASPQPAATPRELPRAAAPPAAASRPPMAEPDIIDPNGPPDPLASDKPANLPRELERAAPPTGLMAAAQKPTAEPPAPKSEPKPAGLQPAANPVRKALTQSDLQKLLTVEQKEAIVDMQKRVRSDGINVQPATEQKFRSLLINIYGPILQQSGYTPAELVENIDSLMDTLLPERTKRKDRK